MEKMRQWLRFSWPFIVMAVVFLWLFSYIPEIGTWAARFYFTGDPGNVFTIPPALQDLLTLTISLLIEATPFLLLGVIASVLVRYAVPAKIWSVLAAKNIVFRRVILSFSGILLPVCECGNVPVARSFIGRGLSAGDAITFLLAAPILNPVVLFVTWAAFSFSPGTFYGRFIAAFVIANVVAVAVTLLLKNKNIIRPEFAKSCQTEHAKKATPGNILEFMRGELLPLFRLLFIGAVVAGAVQVFVPREILLTVGSDPWLGILAMIALGFVISICSSVDAFFALAFAQTFTPGAITAFLVAGPMVDIKMVALMRSTFTVRAIALITGLVAILTLLAGLIINGVVL